MQKIQLPRKKSNTDFMPDTYSPENIIKCINSYIDSNYTKNVSIDISFLNAIDSAYVSTMCSTNHFIKYPDGKIHWTVSSNIVKDFNKDFDLKNAEYEII